MSYPHNIIVKEGDVKIENGDVLLASPSGHIDPLTLQWNANTDVGYISVKDTFSDLTEKINKLQDQVQALETALTYLQLKLQEPSNK